MSVHATTEASGAVLRLTLDAGPGNVLTGVVMSRLTDVLTERVLDAEASDPLRCVLIDAAGPDFCFGASVKEHLPDEVDEMLERFHRLLLLLLDAPVPVLIAVQGRCLGGGLELACAGSRIFAHPSAKLGSPEIKLGVFAPAASALLAARIGQASAEDLLLSGRTVDAGEALWIGLVDELCADTQTPAQAALDYAQRAFLGHSPVSLRFATRAVRMGYVSKVRALLDSLEALYLRELMQTADAKEGLEAFLEKRPPRWQTSRPRASALKEKTP